MNEIYESLKGFTDLPIAVFSLILAILDLKRQKTKGYSLLFFLIFTSAVLGAAVHIFAFSKNIKTIIWIFLYFLLYEAILRFTVLFSRYIGKGITVNTKFLKIFQVILYICSAVLIASIDKYDMLFLVAFSAIGFAYIVYIIFKVRKLPAKATVLISFIPLLLILQGFSKAIPYSIVFEHIIITCMLFVLYLISKEAE